MPVKTLTLPTPALVDKFTALGAAVAGDTIARHVEIELIKLCLVAGQHAFFLGEPGVGKTFVLDRTALRIGDSKLFDTTFGRLTDRTEVIGPVSVAGMKQDRELRIIAGYLYDSRLSTINEIWKANSALLNMLLLILLERKYRMDGKMHLSELSTVLATSNELPQAEHSELNALADRFLVWRLVPPLTDASERRQLLDLDPDPAPPIVLDWAEIDQAKAEARAVKVLDEAKDALIVIDQQLMAAGIHVSERRLIQTMALAKAAAWLEGAGAVDVQHLECLGHTLWRHTEQIATVQRIVDDVAAPGTADVNALSDLAVSVRDQVTALVREIDALNGASLDTDTMGLVMQVNKEVLRTAKATLDLERRTTGGRAGQLIADLKRRLEADWAIIETRGLGRRTVSDLWEEAE